jgi:hypothetical protein
LRLKTGILEEPAPEGWADDIDPVDFQRQPTHRRSSLLL